MLPKSKILIAMIGRARSGKDTTCDIIRNLDPDFKRLAFADELKKMAAEALNITTEDLEKNKALYRPYLIFAGTIFRNYNPEFWVEKLLFEDDVNYKQLPDKIIITDCRYKNELRSLDQFCQLNNYKFIVFKITCSKYTLLDRGYNESIYYSDSETLVDQNYAYPTVTIDNSNSDLNLFTDNITNAFNRVKTYYGI